MARLGWLPLSAAVLLGGMVQLAPAAPLPDKDVARVFGLLAPHADTATRQRAIRELARARDARFIAPLVDQMRFVGSRDELLLIVDTLKLLAGPDAPAANWADMVVWPGSRRFRPGGARGGLLDERGAVWRATDDALVGPGGERLPRVSGQLAYWFGWFAFFPKTELYGGEPAR